MTEISLGNASTLSAARSFKRYSMAVSYAGASRNDPYLSDDSSLFEQFHARINFQWLLNHKAKPKPLALVDSYLKLVSYLPPYISATERGIRLVVLDPPTHWISDPSMQQLYQDFIPVDMTGFQCAHCHRRESIW